MDTAHMDPNVWGPPLWDLLFTLAFRVPAAKREALVKLFVSLEKVIPCQHCRRSYTMYAKQIRPAAVITPDVQDSAAMWLWTIHDMVNQKLGKIAISFDKIQKRHQSFSLLTSDLILVDILALMWMVVKEEHLRNFVSLLCELTPAIPGLHLHALITVHASETSLMDTLHACHIALTRGTPLESVPKEEFLRRIENAYA